MKIPRDSFRIRLARRILLASLFFLIIPLIIYSFIIYIQDYRVKTRDIYESMHILLTGQEQLLKEYLSSESRWLQMSAAQLNEGKRFGKDLLFENFSSPFMKAKFFFIQKDQTGSWKCINASDNQFPGKDFSGYIDFSESKLDSGLYLGLKGPFMALEESLVLGKAFFERGKVESYLFIAVPLSAIFEAFQTLTREEQNAYVSFISGRGQIAASTLNPLVGSKISFTQESGDIFLEKDLNGYRFTFQKKHYLASLIEIENTHIRIMLAVPATKVYAAFLRSSIYLSIFLAAILVFGGGGSIWLARRFSKPLVQLSGCMRQVGEGNLKARYHTDLFAFEINLLGKMFNDMLDQLNSYIERAKEEKSQKEILANELSIGHKVQESLLPKQLPSFPGLEINGVFFPAKEVGGDFYDFVISENQNEVFFNIADTSGKGVFGCLYSLSFRSIFRSYALSASTLQDAVFQTNRLFCLDTGDSGTFVTSWIGLFHKKTNLLEFACCGHLPALLKRKEGDVEPLYTEGMAFGVQSFEKVSTASIRLRPGDYLILYTDGIIDAENPRHQRFSKARFEKLIASLQVNSPKEMVDEIMEQLMLFCEGAPAYDDIALLIIRFLE